MKIHNVLARDAGIVEFVSRPAVRMRSAIEERPVILPGRGIGIILQRFRAIDMLSDNLLHFRFLESRMQDCIHQQVQTLGEIF